MLLPRRLDWAKWLTDHLQTLSSSFVGRLFCVPSLVVELAHLCCSESLTCHSGLACTLVLQLYHKRLPWNFSWVLRWQHARGLLRDYLFVHSLGSLVGDTDRVHLVLGLNQRGLVDSELVALPVWTLGLVHALILVFHRFKNNILIQTFKSK